MDGQNYLLIVDTAPAESGHFYVRTLDGGPPRNVPAASLKLLGFVEG